MKNCIVIQKSTGFQLDWVKMYNPDQHCLILIVSRDMLVRNPIHQLQYFSQIIVLDDVSTKTVENSVLKLHLPVDQNLYVVTNDEHCMKIVAEVREKLNISGDRKDVIEPYLNKDKMKQILAKAGIRTPRYCLFDPSAYQKNPQNYINNLLQIVPLPIFIKPIDGAGAELAQKVATRSDLEAWCTTFQHTNRSFEIDEFIEGTLFHCDTVVKNHNIIWQNVCQYNIPCHLFATGIPLTSWVLPSSDLKDRLMAFANKVLRTFPSLSGNATHMEIYCKSDGELVFVEVAARAPGGRAVRAYEKSCGVNIEELHFRLQMGYEITPVSHSGNTAASAWVLYPAKEMIVTECVEPNIASDYNIEWACRKGDRLSQSKEIEHRVCLLTLWNSNLTQLMVDLDYLCQQHQCVF